MSTCANCGAEMGKASVISTQCLEQLPCARRELANLRSLLRSVTGKLEEVAELLDPPHEPHCASAARELVVSVLEVLS